MVLSCVAVSAVLRNSVVKGMISLTLGLIVGLIGVDIQSGQARFTFGGKVELLDGIEMVMAVVGLFALGNERQIVKSILKCWLVPGDQKNPRSIDSIGPSTV